MIQGENGLTTINVLASVSPLQAAAIVIGSGGYTLAFSAAPYTIEGGTISLPSQSSLSIDVGYGGSVNVTSTIVGSGQLVTIGTGQLNLGSAANSYSGGTYIEYGTLQLEHDPNLKAAASLGSGGVIIGSDNSATLDLNGCPLTVTSLADPYGGGTITDSSEGAINGITGVDTALGTTLLTINVPAGQKDVFSGSIQDDFGYQDFNTTGHRLPYARIGLVKAGDGELDLGGASCSSDFSGGFELDAGTIVLESDQALGGGFGSNNDNSDNPPTRW